MAPSDNRSRSIGEAKAHFAECVRAAEKGHAIVLTRHGRPVARLVPISGPDGEHGASEVREHPGAYEARSLPPMRSSEARKAAMERFLEDEIWPQIPREMMGKAPSKAEREEILGLGQEGA